MRADLKPFLDEYLHTLRSIRRAKKRTARDVDRELLQGMEKDVSWIIEYMASGFIPPLYRRQLPVIPVDPAKLPYLIRRPVPPMAADEVLRQKLLRVLDELSEREQAAVLMVKGEGLSYGEVAKILGVTRGSVQVYVNRAMAKLRQKLGKG